MSEEIDGGVEPAAPIWPVFGDLMSVLLGAFVLILVGVPSTWQKVIIGAFILIAGTLFALQRKG